MRYPRECRKATCTVSDAELICTTIDGIPFDTVSPTSMEAIQGALGTVCEAVDDLYSPAASHSRAFVAIRPPGHHCGEDMPSGFCFVNNVVVGAAHGKHSILPR